MRNLPLYELCLYSGSCNRAAKCCTHSQATLNRAHRDIEELLATAAGNNFIDLLGARRTFSQQLRTALRLCRVEIDPYIPLSINDSSLQIEIWARSESNLSRSLHLLRERIVDVFVGSLYDLEMEQRRQLLRVEGVELMAEVLIYIPLWRVGPVAALPDEDAQPHTLLVDPEVCHPKLTRRLKQLGYQVQISSDRRVRQKQANMLKVVSHLQLPALPIPAELCVFDSEPVDKDVIGMVFSASYSEAQPCFKQMMSTLAKHLLRGLQAEVQLADQKLRRRGG